MGTDFRREVFQLGKALAKNEEAVKLTVLLHNLSITVENKETGVMRQNLHKSFAYVARHSRSQFHGYLFTDDNADSLGLPAALPVEHLTPAERNLIERGYGTLERFIDLCLYEIKNLSPIIAWGMNPYSKYQDVTYNKDNTPFLSDSEMRNATTAFVNGKLYKTLAASNFQLVFNKCRKEDIGRLMHIMEKDISKAIVGDEPADFRNLVRQIGNCNDASAALSEFAILIYALRESLALACQMLFASIDGARPIRSLTVLNNDNIINIEDEESNCYAEVYKVLVQGITFDECGDILLLDCDDRLGKHTHKFGRILGMTMSFASESGDTTKYRFTVVDEELNGIFNITNHIIQTGLPKIVVAP